MDMAHIIVEMHYQQYYTYYRPIRRGPHALNRKSSRGQALFRSWIFGGSHYRHGEYYCQSALSRI